MPINDNAKRLLIVEPDDALRHVIRRFLGQTFHVVAVASGPDALQTLRSDRAFDLILAEMDMAPMTGANFVTLLAEQFPTIRYALMANSRFPVDAHIHAIRRLHCYNVLVKTAPFLFDEFLVHVENILNPAKAVGIDRYLRETARITKVDLRDRADKNRFTDNAIHFFRRYRACESDISEIRLAIEEMVNNSFYHAFRKGSGQEKYKIGTDVTFDYDEQVTAWYAHDEDCLAFAVSDNAGSLDAQVFLGKLERQQTLDGLMDENGRGLHLSRTVSDRMIVNIRPGRLTEMILLFHHKRRPSAKPLLINLINS